MPDTTLPVSGTITDSGGNALTNAEVVCYHLKLDSNKDVIQSSTRLARKQTDANGNYSFTEDDLPVTYLTGGTEEIYYVAVAPNYLQPGSGDPLDNGRFSEFPAWQSVQAYSYKTDIPQTGLLHHYNPANITVSTGSSVSTFPDSESSKDLTGGDPIYEANGMGNAEVPVYDGTDDKLEASDASDWNLFTDGSGFELFVVVQPETSMADTFGDICGTSSGSTVDLGLNIGIDDRSDRNNSEQLYVAITDGNGNNQYVYRSSNGVMTFGEVSVINVRSDGSTVTVEKDGSQLDSSSISFSSSSAPTSPYSNGKIDGSFVSPFGGGIGDNIIYDSPLSSGDRTKVYDYIESVYGVTLS
jgi:hypothetical protein